MPGPITVTDRISVRVSAKSQEQSAAQKRAVGGAIAKSLGNEDIPDSLKDQLGNTTKPVVYDENGNAWISIDDIIAAGRKMNENGALPDKEDHKGLTVNGELYNLAPAICPYEFQYSSDPIRYLVGYQNSDSIPAYIIARLEDGGTYTIYVFATQPVCSLGYKEWEDWRGRWNYVVGSMMNSALVYIADSRYSLCVCTRNGYPAPFGVPVYTRSESRLLQDMAGFLYGAVETKPSSIIDWDAPDAEVERQINELHETWDVSEHEGAVTANGTYVLAGPIEFNPGD